MWSQFAAVRRTVYRVSVLFPPSRRASRGTVAEGVLLLVPEARTGAHSSEDHMLAPLRRFNRSSFVLRLLLLASLRAPSLCLSAPGPQQNAGRTRRFPGLLGSFHWLRSSPFPGSSPARCKMCLTPKVSRAISPKLSKIIQPQRTRPVLPPKTILVLSINTAAVFPET